MITRHLLSLAAIVSGPLLALAQQPGANAATPSQASPAAQSTPDNPVLRNRPLPSAPRAASPVASEGRIHLDVLVEDSAGKPVLGLEPWDFKLLDNNLRGKILSFRAFDGTAVKPNPPVEIVLLLDTVNIPFEQIAFTRQEMAKFLRQNGGHLTHPVSLMVLTEAGLRIQPRSTLDGNALASLLDQIKGSVHTITPAMGLAGDLERLQLSVRQMTTIAENEARRPGRKLLVWVGPGWPMLDSKNFTFSDRDQKRYFDSITELSTQLRQAQLTVYSVSAPWPGMGNGPDARFLYQDFLKGVKTPRQADTGNLALKVLVTETGGRILGPNNQLAKQIDACVQEADAFYAPSFNPPPAEHNDEYHDLRLIVDKPGVTVRTSTGYYDQP